MERGAKRGCVLNVVVQCVRVASVREASLALRILAGVVRDRHAVRARAFSARSRSTSSHSALPLTLLARSSPHRTIGLHVLAMSGTFALSMSLST